MWHLATLWWKYEHFNTLSIQVDSTDVCGLRCSSGLKSFRRFEAIFAVKLGHCWNTLLWITFQAYKGWVYLKECICQLNFLEDGHDGYLPTKVKFLVNDIIQKVFVAISVVIIWHKVLNGNILHHLNTFDAAERFWSCYAGLIHTYKQLEKHSNIQYMEIQDIWVSKR